MEYDRKKEKDERIKAVNKLISEIPCTDLSVPSIGQAEIADLKECTRFKLPSDEMKVLASQFLQSAITNGIATRTFSGALRCNIDISKLAHSQDGFLRGVVMSDGKIAEQAKFTEIPSVSVTSMLAFQIASMITGQYYQHIITSQLNILLNIKMESYWNRIQNHEQEYEAPARKLANRLFRLITSRIFTIFVCAYSPG